MRIIDKGRETPMRVSVAGQVVDVDADGGGGGTRRCGDAEIPSDPSRHEMRRYPATHQGTRCRDITTIHT
jgi:hypothetical protein